jgi:hypothetical protein
VSEKQDSLFSVRSDRWRFLFDRATESGRLYDLKNDPGETRDVAASHPEVVASLRRLLDEQAERDRELVERVGPPADPPVLDEDLQRELRALGYLTDADDQPEERVLSPGSGP